MAELTQQTELYAQLPPQPKTVITVIWKSVLSWLTFFLFQIFIPSITHLFSLFAFRLSSPLLPSSSSASSFKPLPVVELALQQESDSTVTGHVSSKEKEVGNDGKFEKLTVVLDLDETLVCSYETSILPDIVCNHAIESGLKWFDLECVSLDKDCDGKPKVNHVTVFERPGLQEFLEKISEFADLVLFTAGLEIFCHRAGYARPLVDIIDVENRFGDRLYRPSTVSTEYREHVKDLSYLSKDLRRTVIVDNNPFSFVLQPLNGVPCIPFSVGQPYDEQLLGVLLPLLKHLSLQEDVKPILYDRFHMPEWFQQHGIPTSNWVKPNRLNPIKPIANAYTIYDGI
ncbi:hypothetical protein IFM89_014514 [Coptis chinensis]|uniref:FCP1 homology domain-containing protein n=1 Tax=Coptis chinensis TaxID=261450 RepID=A0A835LJA8_9MAGN|nr:hypothetical protein IFM89_014514 [Coptis chinensis]